MKVINDPSELAEIVDARSPSGRQVLVPTMGALHEGHLALIKQARKLAGSQGTVILSLFVNPAQFDDPSDLEHYPRVLEADLSLCRDYGVDLVFSPDAGDIYHADHSVMVTESALSQRLCGATRPGHFDGVCTIVLKLFNLTQPDTAVFGKKDFQQFAIVQRMVRDLNLPIEIVGVETVRNENGLALSSRNQRLHPSQLADAPRIHSALLAARQLHQQGETSAEALMDAAHRKIMASSEEIKIDYLELLDAANLEPIDPVIAPAVMATAVFYGDVRLIDNIELA